MIASDPPDHTKRRRVVSRPFTKRRIAAWEEMATRLTATLVDQLVERIWDDGSADLTKELAVPLPVTLIAEILGVPSSMMARSAEHTSELQSLMRISYAVFCLKTKQKIKHNTHINNTD